VEMTECCIARGDGLSRDRHFIWRVGEGVVRTYVY
jgi:hypothetical protein